MTLEDCYMSTDVKERDPWYNHLEEWVMVISFSVMSILTFLNVITRFVFSFTLSWTEQMCRLCFVWLTLSGISYCALHLQHLKVTALQIALPEKVGTIFLLIGDIFSVVFGAVASYYIVQFVTNAIVNKQTFPSMPWLSSAVMYIPGVVFMLTFAIRVIQASIIPERKQLKSGSAGGAKEV